MMWLDEWLDGKQQPRQASIFYSPIDRRYHLDDAKQTALSCGDRCELFMADGHTLAYTAGRIEHKNGIGYCGYYFLANDGQIIPLEDGMMLKYDLPS